MDELTPAQKSYLRYIVELPVYRLTKRLRKLNNILDATPGETLLSIDNAKLSWRRDRIIDMLDYYAKLGYKQYEGHFKYELPHK